MHGNKRLPPQPCCRCKEFVDKQIDRCWICLPCQRKSEKDYRRKTNGKAQKDAYTRGDKLVLEFKSQPCLDCGRSFPPCAMQFDHVKGVKKREVGNMRNGSIEKLLQEIAKCEVVCAVCHAIRTYVRDQDRRAKLLK